jgi:hypothetical protein
LLRLGTILLPLVLAVAPAPGGLQAPDCGTAITSADPELRASFQRFDRTQSPTAAKACALSSTLCR